MSIIARNAARRYALIWQVNSIRACGLRFISSDSPRDKEIDDKLIDQWKEGIRKRDEAKRTLASEERDSFIAEKKRQLENSQKSLESIEKILHANEPEQPNPKVTGSTTGNQATTNTTDEPNSKKMDDDTVQVKVSGSYQQLVKKIKENENLQELREELKRYGEKQREEAPDEKNPSFKEDLSERLKHNANELKKAFPIVMRIINDLTGYTRVESLKQEILSKELLKNNLKQELATAKKNYNRSIELRSMSQKQINELLQRQNSWSMEDLEKFTELYKSDHTLEKQEHESFQKLQDLEAQKDENDDKLMTSILTRYHEEQIWSDKIRKFSTWGTIMIMGVNLFLFIVVQLIFEPFKRRRLVNSFELKVKELLQQQNTGALSSSSSVADVSPETSAELTSKVNSNLIAEIEGVESMITDIDRQTVSFTTPEFHKDKILTYLKQLYTNITTNLAKIFIPGYSSYIVIDKLQLNCLLGLSFFFSFCIGLIF